jgi:CSLREA domain-containing protein
MNLQVRRGGRGQPRRLTRIAIALALLACAADARAAIFTVTSTQDTDDGACDAHCTLREAITLANASSGADVIEFAIPGAGVRAILLWSPLPAITDALTIDGYTQAGAAANTNATGGLNTVLTIELAGDVGTSLAVGLTIAADDVTVRGLAVNRFTECIHIGASQRATIAGSFIGTVASGTAGPSSGAGFDGVVVDPGATGVAIGGGTAADRNLIAGVAGSSVKIVRSTTWLTSVTIAGNLIGTTATGMAALGTYRGISVDGSGGLNQPDTITIGGATAALGNVIAGAFSSGIEIYNAGGDDPVGTAITIEQNYIGVGVDGWIDLGNGGAGIAILGPTKATVRRNRIVENAGPGIEVSSLGLTGSAAGVVITENRIFANTLWGIDLNGDGRTFNDSGDADNGPNALLNFPVLSLARFDAAAGTLRVTGEYASQPGTTYTLELFLNGNGALMRSGMDAGTFLTSLTVTTDGSGHASFSTDVAGTFAAGQEITTTATHPDGYTSEVANAIAVILAGRPISGTVTLNGSPLSGVSLTVTDGAALTRSATTNAAGAYAFADLPTAATYVVTPAMAGMTFLPSSATVVNLTTDQARDFAATSVPQTFTVNTTDDGNDTVCDATHCSLREAIDAANAHPGPDTVAFNIAPAGAVHTILTNGHLPAITDALLIDGYTQAGASPNTRATGGLDTVLTIELRVAGAVFGTSGFTIASPDVTIRGLAIAGFYLDVELTGSASGSGVVIAGNYLGMAADGVTAVSTTGFDGVDINSGSGVTVGGGTAAARNLISGHAQGYGITLRTDGAAVTHADIRGNLIGTDATGQLARPNVMGIIHGADSVTPTAHVLRIGGPAGADGNVISGNSTQGVEVIRSAGGSDHPQVDQQIWNNYIGVAADGVTALGNGASGVIMIGAMHYRVGHNVIAHNGGAGVLVSGDPTPEGFGVLISQNLIFDNQVSAIDLGGDGATPNDADDSDTGANDRQNYPVLLTAREGAGGTTLTGELHSLANRTYTIEVFTAIAGHQPEWFDARTFVGQVTGTTNASGRLAFTIDAGAIASGGLLIATATDTLLDKTSELSAPIVVAAPGHYQISGTVTVGGAGAPGFTVDLTGSSTASTTTDGTGHYAFTNLPEAGHYTVTPSGTGWVFTPANAEFASLPHDVVADFTAAAGAPGTTQYLAEGATGPFWQTSIAVLNPSTTPDTVTLTFLLDNGVTTSIAREIGGPGHVTIDPSELQGLDRATFSTLVRGNVPIVASRTIRWGDGGQLGAHAEQGVPAPRTTWYFAEGATGCFKLFYLLVNPNPEVADVRITYARRAPEAPVVLTYTVGPYSRFTVPVNDQPGLTFAEVGAQIVVTNNVPIVAERAMYSSCYGTSWRGGHESAASPAPATSWYLAEGATGSFFDLYLLVANFEDDAAVVDVQYLLPDGSTITKRHAVPAHSRLTIDVAGEDARLASTSTGAVVTSTNGVPVLVERSQWWPHGHWYEGHASAGATQSGVEWQLAGAEAGGDRRAHAYLLIANTGGTPGEAQVRLVFDDGSTLQLPQAATLAAYERKTLDLGDVFPAARGQHFGVIVTSLGATPAPVVVELSIYNDTTLNGERIFWGAGTNVVATRVR